MRQAVLYYAFVGICIATAVVILLGIIGIIEIPEAMLTILVSALLIEIAAALIALFRRTDFFADPPKNLASSL